MLTERSPEMLPVHAEPTGFLARIGLWYMKRASEALRRSALHALRTLYQTIQDDMRWRSSLVLIREIHQGTIRSCLSFTRSLHQQDPETLGHGILQTSAHSISSQIRCLDELLKPIENPDPALNKQFQEIIG